VEKLSFLIVIFIVTPALGQVTEAQSKKASKVIGTWLSKSTGHYDFLSATTVNPKRAGDKFFGIPDMQMASDYGLSLMDAPRDDKVTEAYETIGAETSSMDQSLRIPRFHLNLGFANKHDFTFSYLLPNPDEISGWGLGYKRVIGKTNYFYLTYRLNYSRSHRENYFENRSVMNDLSFSLYLRLIDFYGGIRHWAGKVSFDSTIPALELPEVHYFGTASEIEHYFGVIAALTTNSRLTIEANSLGGKYAVAGKLSFHFDSLLPTFNNWFRDPRYIKQ
jgi:hypothetical protein